jgi:hypothetical protein
MRLTTEDDDDAPPIASEDDEEELRKAYHRAAYREAIAHFLPLPPTSCLLCRSYHGAQLEAHNRAVASARAYYREVVAILPANHVIISRDFVDFGPMEIISIEWRLPAEDHQADAAIGSDDSMEEVD